MNSTSASLLERLRTVGDAAAWTRFVQLYTPLLYHWAVRSGLNNHDAGDLVQDVLTSLLEQFPQFRYDPKRRFRGWLWTVTMNRVRERKRRAKSQAAHSGRNAISAEGPDTVAEFAEEEYRRYLANRALQLMKSDFEPASWQIFWEHVVNARPAPEIARECKTTVGAVYAIKSRILARLRAELEGLLD
jgi:RNA polymerase sigma-70 factor (ECF subfamily)